MVWNSHLSFLLKNLHTSIKLFFPTVRESRRPTASLQAFPTPARVHISKGRTTKKLKEVHGLDRWSHYTHDRDRGSSRSEKKWNWYEVDWATFRKVWFKSASSKMIYLSYSRLVMSHWSPPSHACLAGRKLFPPLCPCGAVEDVHHYCFACPLLPPPSPTYADIFKSKTPSKVKPIASLLCEKVMTYSNKFLPSYESKMKFLQGIIIQALLH